MAPVIRKEDPPYLQIAAHLRQQIVLGEIAPGDTVPSTRSLMEEWGVSKATATRALSLLASEGLTEGRAGAGTIVRDRAPIYRRVQNRYAIAQATGQFYRPNEQSRIIAAELVAAPAAVLAALDLADGSQAIRRHRVTHRDGEIVEVSTSWFPPEVAEAAPLLLSTERLPQGTLAYLAAQTGRSPQHGREMTSVGLATREEAEEFSREEPLPLLVTEHFASDSDGEPLTYEVGLCPPGFRVAYDYEIH